MRESLAQLPRTLWFLALGQFVNAAGSFVFVYLFVYLVGPRELGLDEAGLISGVAGAGAIAGNFTGGWFGDHYGHRTVLLASAAVHGAALLVVPWTVTGWLLLVLPVANYTGGVMRAALAALVAESVPAGVRRSAFALSRAAFNAGAIIGPPLGAVLATYSFTWLFVGDALTTFLFAAVALRVMPKVERHVRTAARVATPGLWASLRADRTLLVLLPAILAVDLVYRQLYTTFPVFLQDHGFALGLYGALIAVNAGLILCLELPLAVVLRRLPPLALVGGGLVLVGLGFGVLGTAAALPVVVGAVLLVTVGEMLYKPTATAHVADAAPDGLQGRYQSLYAGASVSGVVLAPLFGSAVYERAPSLLWPACLVVAVLAGVAVLLAGRRARLPATL